MNLPSQKQHLLERAVSLLVMIPNIQAIVIGGSYAYGDARPDSDLDLGIYYSGASPFAVAEIQKVAAILSGDADQEVTDFYEWGQWVNGGSWIHSPDGKVDFLYRNLEQVERTIAEVQQGIVQHDFDQQPAYGFYSVTYLAETKVCVPVYDPNERINQLKEAVASYPPLLKQKTVSGMLWMAEFSLQHADSYAASGNIYATVGTMTRIASFLVQALFALNETYFLSDKTVPRELGNFTYLPVNFLERVSKLLGQAGQTPGELQASVREMGELWQEVVGLAEGSYQPANNLPDGDTYRQP
jgi:predicted nucleotidyltransferase